MYVLLNVVAIIALVAGLVASQVVQSDIRIEVVATCWIGGFLLIGLASILGRLQQIEGRLSAIERRDDPEGAN